MDKELLKKAFGAGRDYEYGKGAYTGEPYPSFNKWYSGLVKESDSLPCVSASTVKLLTAALKDLLEEVDREGWNINGEDYQEQSKARKALAQVPEEYLH